MATVVTVTGTFERAPGVPSQGELLWQLSGPLFSGSASVVASAGPIPVTLDDTGSFTVDLWATNDPSTQPSGLYWDVTGTIDGQPFDEHYTINASPTTVDISQLTPAQPANPE